MTILKERMIEADKDRKLYIKVWTDIANQINQSLANRVETVGQDTFTISLDATIKGTLGSRRRSFMKGDTFFFTSCRYKRGGGLYFVLEPQVLVRNFVTTSEEIENVQLDVDKMKEFMGQENFDDLMISLLSDKLENVFDEKVQFFRNLNSTPKVGEISHKSKDNLKLTEWEQSDNYGSW